MYIHKIDCRGDLGVDCRLSLVVRVVTRSEVSLGQGSEVHSESETQRGQLRSTVSPFEGTGRGQVYV